MAVLTGLLFGVGTYLTMQKSLLRTIVGVGLMSNGSLLALITLGGLNRGAPPIIAEAITEFVDPLPHALILTALVIGLGVTAFMLVLAYRTYQENQTDDLSQLGDKEESSMSATFRGYQIRRALQRFAEANGEKG